MPLACAVSHLNIKESLKKYKDLYQAIFEGSGVAYLLVAAAILEANSSVAEMWGRPKDEIIGRSLADFAPASQPNGRPSAEVAAEVLKEARTDNVMGAHAKCDADVDQELSESGREMRIARRVRRHPTARASC